ncbi:MAG: xanthine dehydrogenase FAD-binding subunit XdhB [Fastidiosipila sp.]|nr:xanthine dehydrogenase FAD-binding subunit XdhB [Fastidiosipila sp.]
MKYDIKKLYEAKSLDEAISLLDEHPEAKIIAGGSDILISVRSGDLAGCTLVSIYGLDDLRGITLEDDGTIRIGSLTSFAKIASDEIINKYVPFLGEAAGSVGGPQVRNIGTIGGNTCNGVTSADTASTLLALDANIEVKGKDGYRYIPIKDWYIKSKQVNLKPTEVQTAILLPKETYQGYFGNYYKYSIRNAMDIATCGCSVNVKLADDKKSITDVRIAYGVAGPIPLRATTAEDAVKGRTIDLETLELFSEKIKEDINPRTSWRASKEFRTHLMSELARRCLTESLRRSGGIFQ